MTHTAPIKQLLFIAAACVALTTQTAQAAAACCEAAPIKAAAHTDSSLFNVASQWQNQTGSSAPLSQVGDRPQLVAMVYTSCQFACPRMLVDLKAIQDKIGSDTASDYGITLITFDPERDTVAAYQAYADQQQLEAERWTFLRGDPSDILEIANLLGVKYKHLPNGEFSHSNVITLLNTQGEIVTQLEGLGADSAELIETTKALIGAK
jgi:protein SCO1/2